MEIERKFIVEEIPFELDQYTYSTIQQAYIHTTPTIRIRKRNNQYILTLKSKGGLLRHELEMPINIDEYESLIAKKEGRLIEKKRYEIPLERGLIAELDLFEGELAPLKYVEVEFSSVDEAKAFKAPDWFGEEVTEDYRYTNQALATLDQSNK
ncbi:CYTH domain-containing protein [Vallitalea okinawensis]|uniref:CYTH domain-containing protein n=1 Tax=Vallitalea okinawensis TaxID=2078660 RepID=UPI000CFDF798|nr:CYTH domain-containing protein [Vallitalea okinawensis]